jgi:CRISPR-associated protein Cas6
MGQEYPVLDLSFDLRGTTIPADHGYALYAAISRHLPWLHGDETAAIHPVRGHLVGGRQLALTRTSRLVLRLPVSSFPEAIRLAGRKLDVNGAALTVGVPTVHPLLLHPSLESRLVVIRGFTEAQSFLEAVARQLAERGIEGSAELAPHVHQHSLEARDGSRDRFVRRTLRIRDKEVVGFAVRVNGLSPEDSVKLQVLGLGGRRRFGCGVFVGTARPDA